MNTFLGGEPPRIPSHRDNVDIVVVGGGQAGLALGYHLRQQHRDFVILDAGDRVGDAWRNRWDSLRLFSPAKYDGLDGMPFPGDSLAFPSKDQEADYLERYASHFGLPVKTGVRVTRLGREGDLYLVEAGEQSWCARSVVIATGGYGTPRVPDFASRLDPAIRQLHSRDYRSPAQLAGGPVLVVGAGNSGAEIARELSRTRPVILAGTPVGEIPVTLSRATARFVLPIVRLVDTHLLTLSTRRGRDVARTWATPLIRTKTADLAAAGVRMVPRITAVEQGRPVTGDGEELDVSNVVWCTGYRDGFGWVDLPAFDGERRPRQWRGVAESSPGLYFLGLEFLYAASSSNIVGMRRDARFLARRIAEDATRSAAASFAGVRTGARA